MKSVFMRRTQILRKSSPTVVLLQMLAICVPLCAQQSPGQARFRQFESNGKYAVMNDIDNLVIATLRKQGIEPANLCSDEVFIRRVYLDVNGSLPEPQEVRRFLKDRRSDKRAVLIAALLERDEFADYWSLKWSDLLRVKA